MSIIITEGQAGDNPVLLPLLEQINVARNGPGRPRKNPEEVVADKAYSHPSTRVAMRAKGIRFTSPERADQQARRQTKGSAGGRPPTFNAESYRGRNVVERCFNFVKQWRGLASRYDKTARSYAAGICLSAALQWI